MIDPGEAFGLGLVVHFAFKAVHSPVIKQLLWFGLFQQRDDGALFFGSLALFQLDGGLNYLVDDVVELVGRVGNIVQLLLHHPGYLETIENLLCCFYILG